MLESKAPRVELYSFTRRTVISLLHSKGSLLNLKTYTQADQVEGFNLLKVFYVLKAVGLVYFIDDSTLTYLGTNRCILKFFKFAKEKVGKVEPEVLPAPESSEQSQHGPQDYPFRPPRDFKHLIGQAVQIGNWEFSVFEFRLLEDFCEQVVMEMLFDPSGLTRQVDQQEVRRGPPQGVQRPGRRAATAVVRGRRQDPDRPQLRQLTSSRSRRTAR